MSIVANIVGRAHVSESNLSVCRRIYKALNKKGKSAQFRKDRKEMYREAIETHKENKDIYLGVIRGHF
jgi:methionine synthase II (cobalamin-independent)